MEGSYLEGSRYFPSMLELVQLDEVKVPICPHINVGEALVVWARKCGLPRYRCRWEHLRCNAKGCDTKFDFRVLGLDNVLTCFVERTLGKLEDIGDAAWISQVHVPVRGKQVTSLAIISEELECLRHEY
jgi:hypothetical protein